MPLLALLASLLALAALVAPPARADAPANDTPAAAVPFAPYTAEAGTPRDLQAVAELADAGPDEGVPRCLGRRSFARTVWYRIPGTALARELTVEASGRTLELVDLAAYVQDAAAPRTDAPNACAGAGAGGSASGEDRTSALTLRVPAGHGVLVQVGRRGARGAPDDERAVLSLTDVPLDDQTPPRGDRAGRITPELPRRPGRATLALGGATTTAEDPAVPACPSRGGVWRRYRPARSGRVTFTATGEQAGALSVFAGARPAAAGFAGCIDREGGGPLVLPVRARRGTPLWVRVGTDRPPGDARALLAVRPAVPGDAADGGACLGAPRPAVGGTLAGGSRGALLAVRLTVARGPVCAARLSLAGPRGRIYARAEVAALRGRGQLVALQRVRPLVPGRYRLRTEATGLGGVRVRVPTSLTFRLG